MRKQHHFRQTMLGKQENVLTTNRMKVKKRSLSKKNEIIVQHMEGENGKIVNLDYLILALCWSWMQQVTVSHRGVIYTGDGQCPLTVQLP